MTKEQKNQAIEELVGMLEGTSIVYLADIAGLDAESTDRKSVV
jgi:ribosomal protein L10